MIFQRFKPTSVGMHKTNLYEYSISLAKKSKIKKFFILKLDFRPTGPMTVI